MDEGLNTFVQFLAEQEFDRNYPSRRGAARDITDYMGGDKRRISPIMTNSESIYQFGPNAYGKPATALNILRETVMGRELFDHAFKEYCRRWAFKHPTPADFFRTMEDVLCDLVGSGEDGSTQTCDMGLEKVEWMQINTLDPDVEAQFHEVQDSYEREDISHMRDATAVEETYLEVDSTLNDYYTTTGKYEVLELDRVDYRDLMGELDADEQALLVSGKNFYKISRITEDLCH